MTALPPGKVFPSQGQPTRSGVEENAWVPSPFVRRFASRIAEASLGRPILDVGCGSGRNAMLFSGLGCTVVCVDKELRELKELKRRVRDSALAKLFKGVTPKRIDILSDPWPFAACSFGGVISVHFLHPSLFPIFKSSLVPGGRLLIETIPGCGGNYIELPKAGSLRSEFEEYFEIEYYHERKVGPCAYESVTVHMVARRNGIEQGA